MRLRILTTNVPLCMYDKKKVALILVGLVTISTGEWLSMLVLVVYIPDNHFGVIKWDKKYVHLPVPPLIGQIISCQIYERS